MTVTYVVRFFDAKGDLLAEVESTMPDGTAYVQAGQRIDPAPPARIHYLDAVPEVLDDTGS